MKIQPRIEKPRVQSTEGKSLPADAPISQAVGSTVTKVASGSGPDALRFDPHTALGFLTGDTSAKTVQTPVEKPALRSSSPQMRGFGLTTDADLKKPFQDAAKKLLTIATGLAQGALKPADLTALVAALPQPADPMKGFEFLGSPSGASSRAAILDAWKAVAAAAPDAIALDMGPVKFTARQQSLQVAVSFGQMAGDQASVVAAARAFATEFPAHPSAPAFRALAGLTGESPTRDPSVARPPWKEGRYALPTGLTLEVKQGDLFLVPPPGMDVKPLLDAGLKLVGDTGKLMLPGNDAGYLAGRYALPGGAALVVGQGSTVGVEPPAKQARAWAETLGKGGFGVDGPLLSVPLQASASWPTRPALDLDVDGTAVSLSTRGVSFSANGPVKGFVLDADGRYTPPRDEDGAMKPGTYRLPNRMELVVGAHNKVTIDLSRVMDSAADEAAEALRRAGYQQRQPFIFVDA